MKYFYSYYPTKNIESEDVFFNLLSIKLSSTILKKLNKRIGIYSNKEFIDLLKKYEIDLDFYEDIENEIKSISTKRLFAVCKLYSNMIQTEPFMQIDTDLFLFDNFNFDLLESSPISFYFIEAIDPYSPYLNYKSWKYNYLDSFNTLCKKFPNITYEEYTNPLIAYNCAIVGGVNYKLISDIYTPIFNLIKNNKTYMQNLGQYPMPVLEQHIITGHLNKLGYTSTNINFASKGPLPLLFKKGDEFIYKINENTSIISSYLKYNETIMLGEYYDDWRNYSNKKLLELKKEKFNGIMHLTGTKETLGIKNLIYEMLKFYNPVYVKWLEKKFGKQHEFQKNIYNNLL